MMSDSTINAAARVVRSGDELSGSNQKMKQAVQKILRWLCPLIEDEDPQFKDWQVCRISSSVWLLYFYRRDVRYELRTDDRDCSLTTYHVFCEVFVQLQDELGKWMRDLSRQRIQFVATLERFPATVVYEPARSREPFELGQDDDPLMVLRSHPEFPGTLGPELEGALAGANPAWPDATIDMILSQLEPPCHTDWSEFDRERKEQRGSGNRPAMVVYVRPGYPPVRTNP